MAGDGRLLQEPERRSLADLARSTPIGSSAFWKGAARHGIERWIGCACVACGKDPRRRPRPSCAAIFPDILLRSLSFFFTNGVIEDAEDSVC